MRGTTLSLPAKNSGTVTLTGMVYRSRRRCRQMPYAVIRQPNTHHEEANIAAALLYGRTRCYIHTCILPRAAWINNTLFTLDNKSSLHLRQNTLLPPYHIAFLQYVITTAINNTLDAS